MKTAKDYTSFLNPGQCTVGSAGHFLFAIKNKIQYSLPLHFPITECFSFMGEYVLLNANLDIVSLISAELKKHSILYKFILLSASQLLKVTVAVVWMLGLN